MKKTVQKEPATFPKGTRFLFLFTDGEMKSAISSVWQEINLTGHHYWQKVETANLGTVLSLIRSDSPPEVLVVDFDYLEGSFQSTWRTLLEEMMRPEIKTKVIFISSILRRDVIQEIAVAKPGAYLPKLHFRLAAFEVAIQKAHSARKGHDENRSSG